MILNNIGENNMRVVNSSNEFFDTLDGIGNGAFVTIGYVTAADLDVPVVKRKNPDTNRMKGYNDYSVFQGEGEKEISALVKLTSYNFNYRNRRTVHDEYHNRIKPAVKAIKQEFGIEDSGRKGGYKTAVNFGANGQDVYSGDNAALFGNTYSPQNMYKPINIKSSIFAVDTNGSIVKELTPENIMPYLKKKNEEISGVSALRKMGADEERIKEYIQRMNDLKFKYRNFEANSILYIVATVDGDKTIYVNDNLKRSVEGIDINPKSFTEIVKQRYFKDLNENKGINNNNMRLTESDLKYIITESVRRIVNEAMEQNEIDMICEKILSMGGIEVNGEMLSPEEMELVKNGAGFCKWYITIGDRTFTSPNRYNFEDDMYDEDETMENGPSPEEMAADDCEKILTQINFYELGKNHNPWDEENLYVDEYAGDVSVYATVEAFFNYNGEIESDTCMVNNGDFWND